MAAKGGKAKAENARRRKESRTGKLPEERVREAIDDDLEDVVDVLIDAALGKGSFAELDNKTRVDAAVKVLYWGIGKPRTEAPKAKEDDDKGGENKPGLSVV